VYSQLHPHLAKPRTPGRVQPRPGLGPSPPGRLRGTAASAGQVLVTLVVAIPLFVWSFREWRRSNLVISALSDPADSAGSPLGGADGAAR